MKKTKRAEPPANVPDLLRELSTLRARVDESAEQFSLGVKARIDEISHALASNEAPDAGHVLPDPRLVKKMVQPCLFNSGCAVGKRGVTAIEIADGEIALVHWFDRTRGERHMSEDGRPAQRLGVADYYRAVLKQDRLQYVFTRIRLLASGAHAEHAERISAALDHS